MTSAQRHPEPRSLAELRRRFAAEEEARRRIAREIHDDLCQRLAASAMELEVVRRELADDARRGKLDAVAASLVELAADLRNLSHDLHPTLFAGRGLAAALADHFAGIERRHGVPVRLSRSGAEGPFPPEVSLSLFRIVQEVLANVVRHAGAKEVQVTLKADGENLHLEISDDGAGFDPVAAGGAGGIGLAGIEERARLLGGRCGITSAPGAGTRIEVIVPLAGP